MVAAPRLCLIAATAVAAALFPGPLFAQARMEARVVMSDDPRGLDFQQRFGFSDAVVTGDTVYLSGVVVGLAPGSSDVEGAYRDAYRRIGAILKRAGVGWDDVVDMTSFHSDVEGQVATMAKVHKTFVRAPFPAWTAIGVARILSGGLTEIKITARKPARAG